jgi:hypothetical protein
MIKISKFAVVPIGQKAKVEVSFNSDSKDTLNNLRLEKKSTLLNVIRYLIGVMGNYRSASLKTNLFKDGFHQHKYIQGLTALDLTDDFSLRDVGSNMRDIHVFDNSDCNEEVFGYRSLDDMKEKIIRENYLMKTKTDQALSKSYMKMSRIGVILPKRHFTIMIDNLKEIVKGRDLIHVKKTKEISSLNWARKSYVLKKKLRRAIRLITIINRLYLSIKEMGLTRSIEQTSLNNHVITKYDSLGCPLTQNDIDKMESYFDNMDRLNFTGKFKVVDDGIVGEKELRLEVHQKKTEKALKNGETKEGDEIIVIQASGTSKIYYIVNGRFKSFTKYKNYKKPRVKMKDGSFSVHDIDLKILKFCAKLTKSIKPAKRPINLQYRSNFTKKILSACERLYQTYDQVRFTMIDIHNCCWRTFGMIYFVRDVLYKFSD